MAGAITVATVSVYLKDPDGNGLELTYDRPRDQWFDERGDFVLKNDRFAVCDLLDEEGAALLGRQQSCRGRPLTLPGPRASGLRAVSRPQA